MPHPGIQRLNSRHLYLFTVADTRGRPELDVLESALMTRGEPVQVAVGEVAQAVVYVRPGSLEPFCRSNRYSRF